MTTAALLTHTDNVFSLIPPQPQLHPKKAVIISQSQCQVSYVPMNSESREDTRRRAQLDIVISPAVGFQ